MPPLSHISLGFIGLPWRYLTFSVALCLVLPALGFKRVVYFVGLGYAASIAAHAIVMPLLYRNTVRDWVLVQSMLLLAYGLRLGAFLALRERPASCQKEQAENAERGADHARQKWVLAEMTHWVFRVNVRA